MNQLKMIKLVIMRLNTKKWVKYCAISMSAVASFLFKKFSILRKSCDSLTARGPTYSICLYIFYLGRFVFTINQREIPTCCAFIHAGCSMSVEVRQSIYCDCKVNLFNWPKYTFKAVKYVCLVYCYQCIVDSWWINLFVWRGLKVKHRSLKCF